jgi:hypothetical protein
MFRSEAPDRHFALYFTEYVLFLLLVPTFPYEWSNSSTLSSAPGSASHRRTGVRTCITPTRALRFLEIFSVHIIRVKCFPCLV